MAYYSATGTGPVSFLDGNQSQQEIPLNEVFFTPNGVDASSWPLFAANASVVPALLAQLVAQGAISAGTLPASPPTLTVTAVQAGPSGNSITLSIASPSAAAGTVTITVTATEVYPNLTPGALAGAIGSSAATAEGLVYVSDAGTGGMPEAFTGAIGAGPDYNAAVPDASDGTKNAFTLAATDTSDDAGAQLIHIKIEPDSSPTPTTFTLTASWTKTASGVTLSSLATTNPLSYLVSFSGQSGPLPAAGSIKLKGGTAASGTNPAVAASASLLSAS
ncbi:MAG TPA: hypothetical protein VGJ21_07070 [Terracidiphilus sp.]|jgi:hypothetical protein